MNVKYKLQDSVMQPLVRAVEKLTVLLRKVNIPFLFIIGWESNGEGTRFQTCVSGRTLDHNVQWFPPLIGMESLIAQNPAMAAFIEQKINELVEAHGGNHEAAFASIGVVREEDKVAMISKDEMKSISDLEQFTSEEEESDEDKRRLNVFDEFLGKSSKK